jgi:hypothetical protein
MSVPRGRSSHVQRPEGNRNQLENRIRHLEQLISNLATQRSTTSVSTDPESDYITQFSQASLSLGSDPHTDSLNGDAPTETKPGRMVSNNDQMIYVSSQHWTAIHDEVRIA